MDENEWIDREAQRLHEQEYLSEAEPWETLPETVRALWRAEARQHVGAAA